MKLPYRLLNLFLILLLVSATMGQVPSSWVHAEAVPYDDFIRIATGKQVRLIVGGSPYDLSPDHRQMLSDFLMLMQQEGEEFK